MTWTIVTVGGIAALFGYALGHLRSAGLPDVRIRLCEALADADGLREQLAIEKSNIEGARGLYLARLDRCMGCATCNPEPDYSQNVTTEESA